MTSKRFPGLPEGVGQARAWVRAELSEHGVEAEAIEEAELVVSEFATNSLLHSRSGEVGGYFTASLEIEPTRALISVTDQRSATRSTPQWGGRPDPLAEHGRGLMLVTTFAEAWTTVTDHDHCTVTARIPLLIRAQRGARR